MFQGDVKILVDSHFCRFYDRCFLEVCSFTTYYQLGKNFAGRAKFIFLNEQLLDEVFVIFRIIKVEVKVISRSRTQSVQTCHDYP